MALPEVLVVSSPGVVSSMTPFVVSGPDVVVWFPLLSVGFACAGGVVGSAVDVVDVVFTGVACAVTVVVDTTVVVIFVDDGIDLVVDVVVVVVS